MSLGSPAFELRARVLPLEARRGFASAWPQSLTRRLSKLGNFWPQRGAPSEPAAHFHGSSKSPSGSDQAKGTFEPKDSSPLAAPKVRPFEPTPLDASFSWLIDFYHVLESSQDWPLALNFRQNSYDTQMRALWGWEISRGARRRMGIRIRIRMRTRTRTQPKLRQVAWLRLPQDGSRRSNWLAATHSTSGQSRGLGK